MVLAAAEPLAAQRPEERLGGADSTAFDSTVYADEATAVLIEAARRHHWIRTDQIEGYSAKITTRSEGRIGVGRFSRGFRLFSYQAVADVHFARRYHPGDCRHHFFQKPALFMTQKTRI